VTDEQRGAVEEDPFREGDDLDEFGEVRLGGGRLGTAVVTVSWAIVDVSAVMDSVISRVRPMN
jgi:hypothetical protein